MLTVEFHCHTLYSNDSLLDFKKIPTICQHKKIDRIAITDHNTIRGAMELHKMDPKLIIPGVEIMTREGELLAFFVTCGVPSGLTPEETIVQLREQGAFISVAHPFDYYRHGAWQKASLERILPLIDSLEVFNSRCIKKNANQLSADFARIHNIIGMVGSDAHIAWEIGRATLHLPEFTDAESLKIALQNASSTTNASPLWIHFTSRYAKYYKRILKSV